LHPAIPRVDLVGATTCHRLTGGNMVVRREVLAQIGPFHEQLGPGASGFSEDDELADRILASGGWIGYVGEARVTHEIDRGRLTEDYFRERHQRQARSRYVYKPRGMLTSILPGLAKAALHYVVFGALGDVRKQCRAKGRWYHYREMLRLDMQRRR